MKNNGASIVIFYYENDTYRRNNLLFVIDYLNKLQFNKEIIVIEQGSVQKYKDSHFIYSGGTFNKSHSYNIGSKLCKYDNIIFHDADVILEESIYVETIKELDNNPIIKPYRYLISLDETETSTFKNNTDHNMFYNNDKYTQTVGGGGVFFIKKNIFLDIRGFDERCIGAGYDDDVFDMRVLLNDKKFHWGGSTGFHLYHPRGKSNNDYILQNKKYFHIYLEVLYNRKIKNNIGLPPFTDVAY